MRISSMTELCSGQSYECLSVILPPTLHKLSPCQFTDVLTRRYYLFLTRKMCMPQRGIPLAILLLYTYFLFYIMYSFTLSRHKHKVLSNNWWCNIVYIRYTFYTTLVYYTNKHLLWLLFMGSRVFNQDILEKKLSISWSAWAHIPILSLIKMLKFAKKKYALLYIFERVPNWHTGMLTQFD